MKTEKEEKRYATALFQTFSEYLTVKSHLFRSTVFVVKGYSNGFNGGGMYYRDHRPEKGMGLF